jgi:SAM-dependent methyltransferase
VTRARGLWQHRGIGWLVESRFPRIGRAGREVTGVGAGQGATPKIRTARVASPLVDLGDRVDALAAYVTSSHWHLVDMVYDLALPTRDIRCPLCEHTSTRDGYALHVSECQFGGGRLERYGCPECDFVFGPMKILDQTRRQLDADYRLLYETYREADNLEAELRAFRSCGPVEGGLYLDWGCGAWSGTVDTLRAQGWDVWGYEPAVPPTNRYIAGALEEISAKFDAIFTNNVIEHLRDPVADLAEMAGHLKPGGVMVHATACYQLRYEHTRFHTSFLLGRSVDVLARRAGLEVVGRERDGEYESVTFRVGPVGPVASGDVGSSCAR